MSKQFSIRVTPDTSPVIQKMLFRKGYGWRRGASDVKYSSADFLVVGAVNAIAWTNSNPTGHEISMDEFLDWFQTDQLPDRLFGVKIGKYDVEIHHDHIKVGCQTISRSQLEAAVACMERTFSTTASVLVTPVTSPFVQALLLSNGFRWIAGESHIIEWRSNWTLTADLSTMTLQISAADQPMAIQEFAEWVMEAGSEDRYRSIKVGDLTAAVDRDKKTFTVGSEVVSLATVKEIISKMEDCPQGDN